MRRVGRRLVGDDVLDPEMAVAVGDTLEQAIKGALEVLGAREDEVDVEILEEGRRTLFGFGKPKPFRVRATWREDDEEIIEEEISSEESAANRRETAAAPKGRPAAGAAESTRSRERRPREARTREGRSDRPVRERAREPRPVTNVPEERAPEFPTSREERELDREGRPRRRGGRDRGERRVRTEAVEPRPRSEPAVQAPIAPRSEPTPEVVARPPRRPEPVSAAADGTLLERARETTSQLLSDMGMEARVTARESEGDIWVAVESDVDDALLIGRRGETRNALQYIVQRLLGPRAEAAGSVIVDVNGYWERRMAGLAEEARALADEVAGDGRERRTEPLTAQERRVVHRALSEDGRVRTESLGDGEIKRVAIVAGASR